MSRLIRIIALDPCVDDVRRLRDCVASMQDVHVSLQHLSDPSRAIARLPKMQADLLFADGYLAKQDLHTAMVGRVIERAIHHAERRNAGERLHRRAMRHMLDERSHGLVGLS